MSDFKSPKSPPKLIPMSPSEQKAFGHKNIIHTVDDWRDSWIVGYKDRYTNERDYYDQERIYRQKQIYEVEQHKYIEEQWRKEAEQANIAMMALQKIQNAFTMNDKRDALFRKCFIQMECKAMECSAKKSWDLASSIYGDLSDMMDVLNLLNRKEIHRALEKYRQSDTSARDKYPQFIAELSGSKIYTPIEGESLKDTE